jgi:TonB family protein
MLDARESAVLEGSESEARWIPDVRLLVHLPSRRETFLENLRDLIRPPQLPELHLTSAPAAFWHDVFVERSLPWNRFLQSGGYHALALALLLAAVRFLPSQKALQPAEFHHDQVVYYAPSEYLPPIDTRRAESSQPQKADPVPSRQPIISLPREADNHSQTIVSAPNVKLDHDVALPNIVSWNDQPKMPVGPAPLIAASRIERIAPQVENSIVAPPPDPTRLNNTRQAATMQSSIVAPPPSVDTSHRRVGDISIAPTAVVAPAPQLAVGAQRALPGSVSNVAGKAQVVPPPPSVAASSGGGTGHRMVALNLHPAVGAPPDSAPGNRRGSFAAGPEGRAGATGTPGSNGHGSSNQPGGSGSAHSGNLPAGLYVGKTNQPTSAVAGDPAGTKSASNSANVPPARVTANSHPAQPANATNLTDQERAVFADRKLYAMTLNMPNLNSAGGTWIVRFAELKKSSGSDSVQLYAPAVTRKVDPSYPMELMHENVSGTVILYAVIHSDGTVGNVRVLRAVDDRLDRFAAQAIRQWQFQPAIKNGVAIDVEATFHIPFKPARSDF